MKFDANANIINVGTLVLFVNAWRHNIVMNGYISVKQAAVRWDISTRQVQKLCNEGRVQGAVQFANVWVIPEDTEKPTRTAKSKPGPKQKISEV